MFSKGSQIKSKKQKMNEKRYYKQQQKKYEHSLAPQTPKKPIEVIVDSDSSHSVELVEIGKEKVKEEKGKSKEENQSRSGSGNGVAANEERERKFNNFNLQRIKKSNGIYKFDNKPTILAVAQCLDGIESADSNRAISYKRAGISAKKTICQNYLKTRLQAIPEQPIPIDSHPKVQSKVEGEEEQDQPRKRRAPRYFDDQVSSSSEQDNEEEQDDEEKRKKAVKCYRCGQRGHIARLCNQREILRCLYCLGLHHNSDCTDRLCHRCNQKGHIKQQCTSDKIQCRRCRQLGHVSRNCGKILMMNYTADRQREIRDRYKKEDLEKLKCLKCNGYRDSKGHFNCQEYSKRVPRIYDEPYAIL